MKKIIFKFTILNEGGVIEQIGVYDEESILPDATGKMNYKVRKKQELIDVINKLKDSKDAVKFRMITEDGTEVIIVDNKYFRTDGDENESNDLLDLISCK